MKPIQILGHRFLPRAGNEGTTRIDILASAFVLGLLAVLALPGLAQVPTVNDQTVCQAHLQQLAKAWRLYATDNEGNLPASGRHSNRPPDPPDWTTGSADPYDANGEWLDLPVSSVEDIDPSVSIIEHNKMWPYVRSVEVFRCPSDPSYGSDRQYKEGAIAPRVRSISMNSWMGGPPLDDSDGNVFFSTADIRSPSERFVFIDERADSINDGTFVVDISAERPFGNRIVDYPAHYHNGGANLSFADNHVEYWKWEDRRTVPPYRPQEERQLNVASPNNTDMTRLQSVSTRF